MIPAHLPLSASRWAAPILAFLILLEPAPAAGLRTVEKQIPSYSQGLRTYTCLAIDGGVVPLFVPSEAKLKGDEELKIVWPKNRASAVIRKATAQEVVLLDKMDQPDGPVEWKRYLASTLGNAADQYAVRDFEPGILAVNHWRIGAMSMDYSFSGVRTCALLLLWRCQDGSTIAVTMRTGFDDFKAHRNELYAMIGGAMLIPE